MVVCYSSYEIARKEDFGNRINQAKMIRSRHAIRRLVLAEQHHHHHHHPGLSTSFVARFGSFEGLQEKNDGAGNSIGTPRVAPVSFSQHGAAKEKSNGAAKMQPRGDWKSIEYQGAAAHSVQFQRLLAFVDGLELPLTTATNGDEQLLSNKNDDNKALPPPLLVREALQYFNSLKAVAYLSKQKRNNNTVADDAAKNCTIKLLDFIEYQYRTNEEAKGEWIESCIGLGDSPCYGLVGAINLFLRPFKGSSFSIRIFGVRKQRRGDFNGEDLVEALTNATRVHRLMEQLTTDPACPRIKLDWNMFLVVQQLWKSRCWYFGSAWDRHRQPSSGDAQTFGGVTSAQECIDIMSQTLEQMESAMSPTQREAAYTMFLGALAHSGIHGAATQAMEVVKKFEERQLPSKPNLYSTTMLAFANEAKYNKAAVHKAQELWDHIVAARDRIKPDPIAATTLLTAYSNAEMPEEIEKMLVQYDETSASTGRKTSRIDYNIAINSWAKSPKPQATERALALFRRMLEFAQSGDHPDISPDIITYTSLIDAFARNPNTGSEGLDQAESLLRHAESGDDPSVQPDALMYGNYMSALSTRLSRQHKSYARADIAKRITDILRRMRAKSKTMPDSEAFMWHNAKTYGIAMAAWSKSRSPRATHNVLQLYKEMKTEAKNIPALKPTMFVYHSLLTCLGARAKGVDKRTAFDNVTQARAIVTEMQRDGFPETVDTMNLYFKVLMASEIPQAVQEAERNLQSLEKAISTGESTIIPNTFSYQIVLEGYSRIEGGAEHAERLLHQVIALSSERPSLELNHAFFNIVMDAWARSRRDDAVDQAARVMEFGEECGFQPTDYTYTTLINALAYSGREDAPELAETLLGQMQSDFDSGKNHLCKPTDAPISAVIKCWELSGKPEAPDRIDAIVERFKYLSDNHKGYSNLNLNYSSLKHAILAWMKITDKRPDAGDRATKYLDVVDKCNQEGKLEIHFAIHCYNAVLVTIARSRDSDKAGKAYTILKRMEEHLYLRSRDYRAVLSACNETAALGEATLEQKEEAFRIASLTFLEYLESKLKPDEGVYNDMFRVHMALLDNDDSQQEREMFMGTTFSSSPIEIQQSSTVRAALRAALSTAKYEEIIKEADEVYLSHPS